jgi:hypothetical protein
MLVYEMCSSARPTELQVSLPAENHLQRYLKLKLAGVNIKQKV